MLAGPYCQRTCRSVIKYMLTTLLTFNGVRAIAMALLLFCARAQSAVVLVPGQNTSIVSGDPGCSVTSCSLAFPSSNTVGCLILVAVIYAPANTGTVTDSQGNAYTRDILNTTANGRASWHAPGIKAGGNTVNVTNTSGVYIALGIAEFCGYGNLVTTDKAIQQTGTSQTSWSSGSATTVQNGELVTGFGSYSVGASVIHLGSGFTLLQDIDGDLWEYQIQPTAGSIAATFTTDTNVDYIAYMVTFYDPPSNHHSAGVF